MHGSWIKPFFILAALYDLLLGLAFLLFSGTIFQSFGVTPPNHPAYVSFPALLLMIFGVMFLKIAGNPSRNRDLIWYGVALKAAYSGSAFWYQLNGGVPFMWLPWAWADLVFLAMFIVAWRNLGTAQRPQAG
jgi:hypothetical protein